MRASNEQGRGGRWVAIEPRHLALDTALPAAPDLQPAEPAGSASASTATPSLPVGTTLRAATEAFQRQWLESLLARHGGHVSKAAREAGMDRSNFHRLLRNLGVPSRPPGAAT